jgi:hypothetical protein
LVFLAVVGRLKEDDIRSHADLQKKAEPLHAPACEFYAKLAYPGLWSAANPDDKKKSEKNKPPTAAPYHVVDVFACR